MTYQRFITVLDHLGEGWTFREGETEITGPERIPALLEGQQIQFTPDAVEEAVRQHQIQTGTYEPGTDQPEQEQEQ